MTKLLLKTILALGLVITISSSLQAQDVIECHDNCEATKASCVAACSDDACRTKCDTDAEACYKACK